MRKRWSLYISKTKTDYTRQQVGGILQIVTKKQYTKEGSFIMLSHNIFYVATKTDSKIGTYAIAGKINASNNLCGLVACYDTFNICRTYKDAKQLADFWNDCYKKNGKQIA